jgi:hypothetical protein
MLSPIWFIAILIPAFLPFKKSIIYAKKRKYCINQFSFLNLFVLTCHSNAEIILGLKFIFRKHFLAIVLLAVVLITGLLTYKTYGTYWDEYLQRDMGKVSYNYVFHHDQALKTFMDKDYGVLIELPLYAMEVKLFANNFNASIEARHLCCFLIFFVGLVFFYALLLKLKFSIEWATIGMAMLVLSPRIYGHSFFNSKDIPLMVFYIIAFYTLLLLIQKQNYSRAILHAFVTGLLINIRITGIIIIPFTIFFLMAFLASNSFNNKQAILWLNLIKILLVYLILSTVFVYLFWPFLWENPFQNFITTFNNMSKFRWDGYTYLMGEHIRSIHSPWYYLPKWIAITTPVFYLFAFSIGVLLFFNDLIRKKVSFFLEEKTLNHWMVLSFLSGPIVIIIYLNSTLYDSWRHVYFVYPFLIISGLYGLSALSNYLKKYSWSIIFVAILFTSFELIKMVQSHPYHYVYFNEIPEKKRNEIIQKNDVDFWGVSFKQGFEKILQLDQRQKIKIYATSSPAYYNYLFLNQTIKNCRIEFVDDERKADYYITNYRYDPNDHAEFKNKKLFSLEYANSEFITVFKVN